MKKFVFAVLFVCFYLFGAGQTPNKKEADKLLKETSDNACKCIDSIDTRNKSSEEISKEVNKCIDRQEEGYQLTSKIMTIDLTSNIKTPEKRTIDLVLNTNKNSDEYKKYYYEIEKYLRDHCKALKMTLAASNIENEKSVSKNQAALALYSKGLKYFKNDDYKKALPYFEKAVKADSVFAFAWDNIGICYRRQDNYDAAIYAYNRSLAIDPNGITPLQNIAVAYEYKKEYDKAIKAYETLSELDSFNPEVFYGKGRVYAFHLNDYEKGLDNMCKAYNLYTKQKSPYRVDAEKLISSIYEDMKKLNNTDKFNEILKANNINADFK